jgi:hypothetical protein
MDTFTLISAANRARYAAMWLNKLPEREKAVTSLKAAMSERYGEVTLEARNRATVAAGEKARLASKQCAFEARRSNVTTYAAGLIGKALDAAPDPSRPKRSDQDVAGPLGHGLHFLNIALQHLAAVPSDFWQAHHIDALAKMRQFHSDMK